MFHMRRWQEQKLQEQVHREVRQPWLQVPLLLTVQGPVVVLMWWSFSLCRAARTVLLLMIMMVCIATRVVLLLLLIMMVWTTGVEAALNPLPCVLQITGVSLSCPAIIMTRVLLPLLLQLPHFPSVCPSFLVVVSPPQCCSVWPTSTAAGVRRS
jgi:hypothetical protein